LLDTFAERHSSHVRGLRKFRCQRHAETREDNLMALMSKNDGSVARRASNGLGDGPEIQV